MSDKGLEDWQPPITVVGHPDVPPNTAFIIDGDLAKDLFFGTDRTQLSRLDIPLKSEKVSLWRRLRRAWYAAYWAFIEAWHD